jgi:hypothetical protein
MLATEPLLITLFQEVAQGRVLCDTAAAAAGSRASQQLQNWQKLLHSPQLLWLLCLNQAIYAQHVLHQMQSQGGGSSSSSHQAVPAYHEQMFAALGVTAISAREHAAHNLPVTSDTELAVLRTAVLSHAAWKQLARGIAHSDGSSSSSFSTICLQDMPREQLLLLQPWVLLQLELLLLVTRDSLCKQMLLQNTTTMYGVGKLLHSHMGSSEATAEVFWRSLLQPVLQLALPHMQEYIGGLARHAVTAAAPGSSAESSSLSSEQQREMQMQAALCVVLRRTRSPCCWKPLLGLKVCAASGPCLHGFC